MNKNIELPKSLEFVLKINKVIIKDKKSFGFTKTKYDDANWASEDYVDKY